MVILNLNVHEFAGGNVKSGNSLDYFCEYIGEKSPDILVLQECKNVKALKEKLINDYMAIYPCEFDISENSYSITVIFVKKDDWMLAHKPNHLEVRPYRWVEIENLEYSILGVHIPAEERRKNYSDILIKLKNGEKINKKEIKRLSKIDDPINSLKFGKDELKALDSARMLDSVLINCLKRIKEGKRVIVLGDMNPCIPKKNDTDKEKKQKEVFTMNSDRLEILRHIYIGKTYMFDAWERCVKRNKAFTIGVNGNKVRFESLVEDCRNQRTYVSGTHIDYAFYSSNIDINQMIIDENTLRFTDHCALLLYINDSLI